MKPNPLKRNLEVGGTALGTMVFEFATPGVARIAASAGAEFVVFDQEHSGWGIETIRMLMATARAAELVPLVRVPSTQHHFISRPLDVGASGVMVPMVETAEQASAVVTAAKYPPEGERGAAFGIGHDDYEAAEDVVSGMQHANDETLLIAQIETTDGIANVEEIAAVDGVDVLWIGHNDLTNSIGIPGQFDHPDYLRRRPLSRSLRRQRQGAWNHVNQRRGGPVPARSGIPVRGLLGRHLALRTRPAGRDREDSREVAPRRYFGL